MGNVKRYDHWLTEVGKFMVEPGLINRLHVFWPRSFNQGRSPEEAHKAASKVRGAIWGQQ